MIKYTIISAIFIVIIGINYLKSNEAIELNAKNDTNLQIQKKLQRTGIVESKATTKKLEVPLSQTFLTSNKENENLQLADIEKTYISISKSGIPSLSADILKTFNSENFENFLDTLNQESSNESEENKWHYNEIFLELSNSATGFELERIECGKITCVISAQYNNIKDVDSITKALYASNSKFDSKALIVISPYTDGFEDYHRFGFLFTTKNSGIKRISQKIK